MRLSACILGVLVMVLASVAFAAMEPVELPPSFSIASTAPATAPLPAAPLPATAPTAASDELGSPLLVAVVLVVVVLLAVAAVAGALVLLLLALLALLGILSTSVVVGLAQKSAGAGVRAFVYQAMTFAGLLLGLATAAVVHWIHPQTHRVLHLVLAGGASGMLLGLLFAGVMIWATRLVWRSLARDDQHRGA